MTRENPTVGMCFPGRPLKAVITHTTKKELRGLQVQIQSVIGAVITLKTMVIGFHALLSISALAVNDVL